MRLLDRRLHRLEIALLPPVETEEPRRLHQIALDIRCSRAARLDLPMEEADSPEHHPVLRRASTRSSMSIPNPKP